MAAYLLCRMGGNDTPTFEDVTKVLNSVNAKVEEDRINHLVKELNGKDIQELLEKARKEALENDKIDQYLAQQGGGGGASQAPQGADAGTKPADKADAKTKAKGAEKKESSSDSLDGDMGFGLFD